MSFVGRRLLQLIPVAVGVTIVCFFMIHLIPGDPATTILGIHATPQKVALLHKQWGLDRSLAAQYWLFMDRLLHANLGTSLIYGTGASTLIWQRLPVTLWLIIYATVLAITISVPLAMIAATRKDGLRDHAVRAVPLIGLGMPPEMTSGKRLGAIFSDKQAVLFGDFQNRFQRLSRAEQMGHEQSAGFRCDRTLKAVDIDR
jgi:peptide/nickel transport system permease protein